MLLGRVSNPFTSDRDCSISPSYVVAAMPCLEWAVLSHDRGGMIQSPSRKKVMKKIAGAAPVMINDTAIGRAANSLTHLVSFVWIEVFNSKTIPKNHSESSRLLLSSSIKPKEYRDNRKYVRAGVTNINYKVAQAEDAREAGAAPGAVTKYCSL